jgi:hypothetical protein
VIKEVTRDPPPPDAAGYTPPARERESEREREIQRERERARASEREIERERERGRMCVCERERAHGTDMGIQRYRGTSLIRDGNPHRTTVEPLAWSHCRVLG